MAVFVKHLSKTGKSQMVIKKNNNNRTDGYFEIMKGKALVSSNSSHT